jgi:hypothetical protein
MTAHVVALVNELAPLINSYHGVIMLKERQANGQVDDQQWRCGVFLCKYIAPQKLFKRFLETPWGDCGCLMSDLARGDLEKNGEVKKVILKKITEILDALEGRKDSGDTREYLLIVELVDPEEEFGVYRLAKCSGQEIFLGPQVREGLWDKIS